MGDVEGAVGHNSRSQALDLLRGNPVIGIEEEKPVKACSDDARIARGTHALVLAL